MQVYVTKSFRRFQRRERIDDALLWETIERADDGLIDADLGGGLIKQRVARKGQGRRGGYRTIVAYRTEERAVFLYGFAKSEKDNIAPDALKDWRVIGSSLLNASADAIEAAIGDDELMEVYHDQKDDRP